ncbi:MAG: hypothetical protein B6226_03120 [Candidatus Cloacimonetes bacterium 4572_65]|nr:MAG: hypothetical protein B6226_03120 [Candidatus Cloacimonetes bacterium 4572_65]
MKIGILKAFRNMHKHIIKACEELKVDYVLIDLIGDNWLEEIEKCDCDGFICRPPSKFQERKSMFDERLYIIKNFLNKPIYPSFDELFIYENKKMMAYWLKINKFPHARTNIFYRKEEYFKFLETVKFPIVFKTNIGSTSKGVKIINSVAVGKSIGNKVFGLTNSKLAPGYTPQRTGKLISFNAVGCVQKHYAIIQEFIPIKWEWRMIKIGESYFGHKKLLNGKFASGSKQKGWDKPPKELLLMVKDICDKGNFYSMDADIFEAEDGKLYVNELQSIFGQSTESLMYIDGKAGRYILKDGEFIFEEGLYNQNISFNLRVKHFISILEDLEKR